MKFICQQADLTKALSVVNRAVSSRSTLPILSNILLVAEQSTLKLSATNLEIGITVRVAAEIFESGAFTLPAKTFTDLMGSLREGQIEVSLPEESNTVEIVSEGSRSWLKGTEPSEFPQLPINEYEEPALTIDASLLKEMVNQVEFAAAEDDSRPVFTAIQLETQEYALSLAAADVFRVALRTAKAGLEKPSVHEISKLIPAKTLTELVRILPSDGSVQMFVLSNRSQVLFHTEQIDLVSRLIEGTYPNIYSVIPTDYTTRVVVETKEFIAAVKSVVPFARDSKNIVRVKVVREDGLDNLVLEATAEDVGSNVSTIDARIEGPEQQVLLNAKYLSDVLNVIDVPNVALEMVSASKPAVIKPVGDINHVCVVMPMTKGS